MAGVVNLSAMRIRITFSNAMKQVIQAAKVEFERVCDFEDCRKLFYADWPTTGYCSDECQRRAKYRRWQTRPRD
jgi:hypothetical protein